MAKAISGAAKSSMDFLSKKMGLTGIFIGYVFYMSDGPEMLRVKMATIALAMYLISQKTGDIIELIYHPKNFDVQGFMDRMSKTLTMTGGFLTALFTANFSPELQLTSGFIVTITYLVSQGIYEGVKKYRGLGANPNLGVEVVGTENVRPNVQVTPRQ